MGGYHAARAALADLDPVDPRIARRPKPGAGRPVVKKTLQSGPNAQPLQPQLSRRERQIMDVLYRLGEAGAAEVVEHLPDRPAYNSVRVTLGILERKGMVRHRRKGTATSTPHRAARDGTRIGAPAPRSHVLPWLALQGVLTLLDSPSTRLTAEELNELAAGLEAAKREKRS